MDGCVHLPLSVMSESSDDLRGLRTMEDMEQKKKEIIEELSLIHRETHVRQLHNSLINVTMAS